MVYGSRNAFFLKKLLYNYIHLSDFSERANRSPGERERENLFQLRMAYEGIEHDFDNRFRPGASSENVDSVCPRAVFGILPGPDRSWRGHPRD